MTSVYNKTYSSLYLEAENAILKANLFLSSVDKSETYENIKKISLRIKSLQRSLYREDTSKIKKRIYKLINSTKKAERHFKKVSLTEILKAPIKLTQQNKSVEPESRIDYSLLPKVIGAAVLTGILAFGGYELYKQYFD